MTDTHTPRKILITGGAGFIGSHLAEHFSALPDVEVVVLDNLRSGYSANLTGTRARLVRGTVTDRDAVLEAARGADYIFHMSAMTSVPESMEKPWDCVENNVLGTLAVLEAARAHRVRKVVFSSSAAIYGDEPESPKHEQMRPAPRSPYGISKLDGEYLMELYRREYGVPTVSLRYFNVFGPRQDPQSQYAAVVPTFIYRALRHQDLVIYGDGEQTRDLIYVKDVAAANVLAATAPALHGPCNVARGGRMTVNEVARTVVSAVASPSRIRHEAERPGDIRHSQADISRIRRAGFCPRHDLAEGLRATIEFFRQQELASSL